MLRSGGAGGACLDLPADEVHVWRLPLDPTPERLAGFAATLSADEQTRAGRFRTEVLRRRFVAGRGGLRAILGAYLGCEPGRLAFAYGTHGKPSLAGGAGFEFNLAHSRDLGLCALARGRPVGVDLESVRPMADAERIVLRFFSAAERREFLDLPVPERLAAFFRGWSRKEAFLKATGTGLATVLDSFDVALGPDGPGLLRRVGDDPAEAGRWSLLDLDAGPGFAAALAVAGRLGREAVRWRDGLPAAHS